MSSPFTTIALVLLMEAHTVSVAWVNQPYLNYIIYFAGRSAFCISICFDMIIYCLSYQGAFGELRPEDLRRKLNFGVH